MGSVRKKSSGRVAEREPQGETAGKRAREGDVFSLAHSIKSIIL